VILAYDYSDKLAAQGSGVVLNDKGYVVTNYHVLSGNYRLEIMHGDEVIPYVDIIGIDVESSLHRCPLQPWFPGPQMRMCSSMLATAGRA